MNHSLPWVLSETKDTESLHPIRPDDIELWDDGSVGVGASFGGSIRVGNLSPEKMRRAAGCLVKYFQWRGYWCAFALEDLVEFYRSRGLTEHL
ncbi:hypothetical protein HYT05_04860, partial [Candidatus Kaiserbacteria bacterium]|nr:hypothetical protein [Candidatus Kaiserbacteria bacterium]